MIEIWFTPKIKLNLPLKVVQDQFKVDSPAPGRKYKLLITSQIHKLQMRSDHCKRFQFCRTIVSLGELPDIIDHAQTLEFDNGD